MRRRRIACFHLFNDFSGSPRVLEMALRGLLERGWEVDLHTSDAPGVLSSLQGLPGFRLVGYKYCYSPSAATTMWRYSRVQVLTFFRALRYAFSTWTVFYINTLLPAGPALAGWLSGHRVVYHYHENADVKGMVYRSLSRVMRAIARRIVCVSAYQASLLGREDGVVVVPNALPADFAARLVPNSEAAFLRRTVMMVSSLKGYKGTREFVQLASMLPQFNFTLVINDTREAIDEYFKGTELPENLNLFERQADIVPFYNKASMVINLSNPKIAIETFGLTALEAMTAGLPVIVPEVGGIAEMVEDGINGYHIDVANLDKIAAQIKGILSNRQLYLQLSQGALATSRRYSAASMNAQIAEMLESG